MLPNNKTRLLVHKTNIAPTYTDGQEYIVCLNDGVDYDKFWQEMETITKNHKTVPDRAVRVLNERKHSLKSCHYVLWDDEVAQLQNDSRVASVNTPPQYRPNTSLRHTATQAGNFTKPDSVTASDGDKINWGLARTNNKLNNYIQSQQIQFGSNGYDYTLDGSGVDVVIMDTGLQVDHPEFTDASGASRVQIIDWYQAAGLPGPGDPGNIKYTASVSSNSYIALGYTNGAAIYIGNRDTASENIYAGSEDSNRSYRIRFEGDAYYQNHGANNLIWEVRFFDNNWIEVCVIRHDLPTTNSLWAFEDNTGFKTINLNQFALPSLIGAGAIALSFVITSPDNGLNWALVGDSNNSYHVELVDNVWTTVAGVANYAARSALPILHSGYTDDNLFGFVTPFDWIAPFSGFTMERHYKDTIGHGTHVAGIAAGKTYGWAKNASIYSIKLEGLGGNEGGAIPYWDAFDVLMGWHMNKMPDPTTGLIRPTVVNMSWGWNGYYYTGVEDNTIVYGGAYRGSPWSGNGALSDIRSEYGMGNPNIGTFPVHDYATDMAIEELLAIGIHVCIAAGNDAIKIDLPNGPDYQNYFTDGFGYFNYYNQGGSPYSPRALLIGSVDVIAGDNNDIKADYSNGGPGVDCYTPGTSIMSSMSTTNDIALDGYQDAIYFLDNIFKQANLSGTSMASPQIAGLAAIFLQLNPHATPAQLKQWLISNSQPNLYDTLQNNDYQTYTSIWGGANRMIWNPYNDPISLRIGNV